MTMQDQKYYYKRLRCFNCGHEEEYQIPWGVEWDHYMNGGGVKSWAQGPTCPKCGCRNFHVPITRKYEPIFEPGELQSVFDGVDCLDEINNGWRRRRGLNDDPLGFKTLM